MVTSYYIMKMTKNKNRINTDQYFNNVYNAPISKELKDDSKCRVCLEDGSVSVLGDVNKGDIKEALKIFANIELNENDLFPKHLCKICYKFIKNAIMFRKIANKTNHTLKQLVNTNKIGQTNLEDSQIKPCNNINLVQQLPKMKKELDAPLKVNKEDIKTCNTKVSDISAKPYNDTNSLRQLPEIEIKIEPLVQPHTEENEGSNQGVQDDWVQPCNDVNSLRQLPDVKDELDPLVKLRREEIERGNRRIQCQICKKMVRKTSYKKHKTLHDPNHPKYVCDICGKLFKSRSSQYNHSLRHVNNGFPHKCPVCPYRGKYSELLNTHMKIHSSELRYVCKECPAKFRYKQNLNSHVISKHKERQHKCDACIRAFHTKLALQRHINVDHLGIRSHECNICGNTYGSRNAMMKHQRAVHKREKMKFGRMPSYLLAESKNQDTNE